MDTDKGYTITEGDGVIWVSAPYGDTEITAMIVSGLIRFPSGYIHLDYSQPLMQGILEVIYKHQPPDAR